MKRNRLMYALPLACLLATAAASRIALAADSSSGYGTSSNDSSMSNPKDTSDTMGKDQSSSGHAMSDSAITAKVKTALLAERGLPSSQIKVQTNDGVVQLSGFLNSQSEIDRAVSVARNIKDVKSVENNMQTK